MNTSETKWLLAVDCLDHSMAMVNYFSKICIPENNRVVLFHVELPAPDAYFDRDALHDADPKRRIFRDWVAATRNQNLEFMEAAKDILVGVGFKSESVLIKAPEMVKGIARDIFSESKKGYGGLWVARSETHDRNDTAIGSVTVKLVSKCAHLPIVVVGTNPDPRSILVGIDGSDGAMRGVDFLCGAIKNKALNVGLVHVIRCLKLNRIRSGSLTNKNSVFSEEHVLKWQLMSKENIRSELDRAVGQLEAAGWPPYGVSTKVIMDVEKRSKSIVQEATDGNYGTIVVGRRGASVVKEFFLGRVGQKVLDMANDKAVWIIN